jgi:hypothetical protein
MKEIMHDVPCQYDKTSLLIRYYNLQVQILGVLSFFHTRQGANNLVDYHASTMGTTPCPHMNVESYLSQASDNPETYLVLQIKQLYGSAAEQEYDGHFTADLGECIPFSF